MSSTCKLTVAGYTHVGKIRERNQDCIVLGDYTRGGRMRGIALFEYDMEDPVLCLVADGMGGHAAGEVASRFVAERLLTGINRMADGEEEAGRYIQEINKELYELMNNDSEKMGMGTTVAGIVLHRGGVVVFNVGDSRVYKYSDGFLRQISIDDTAGEKTYGTEGQKKYTSAITQALGGAAIFSSIEPHIAKQECEDNVYYLICSDGLTDMVGIDDLESCMKMELGMAVKAMEAGGVDNVSIVIVAT